MTYKWAPYTRNRADRDHTHKKLVRKQKQHLRYLKSDKQMREIRYNSKRRQVSQSRTSHVGL